MLDDGQTPMKMKETNRREFVRASACAAAAGPLVFSLGGLAQAAEASEKPAEPLIRPGDTVLFQGDSITDAGRQRDETEAANKQTALGGGYAWLATCELLIGRSNDKLRVFNRGISGNKVFQLADRWQTDCLDLKPNVLSILIGVNDYWHHRSGKYEGTLEVYEKDYHALVQRTREALPEVKLVICEPFLLLTGAVKDEDLIAFTVYRMAAKRVAEEGGAKFIPYQTMFDEASKLAPPKYWSADGIHPSLAGASLMAHFWLQVAE